MKSFKNWYSTEIGLDDLEERVNKAPKIKDEDPVKTQRRLDKEREAGRPRYTKGGSKDNRYTVNKESAQIDEISQATIDRYNDKAYRDQPAGNDGSAKYRKRSKGRELAFLKSTGRAKQNPPESRSYNPNAKVYKGK